ncbi:MAG: hypothetical protein M3347_12350, partial [Armatimonadota bacterium]|nr:hypothetical protein [Armatimonadota bacterium]
MNRPLIHRSPKSQHSRRWRAGAGGRLTRCRPGVSPAAIFILGLVTALTLPSSAAEQVVWGEPLNGLQIGIAAPLFVPSSLRQPMFTVTLRNVSDHALTLPSPAAYMKKQHPEASGFHAQPLRPLIKYVAGKKALYSITAGDDLKKVSRKLVTLQARKSLVLRDVPLEERFYRTSREADFDGKAALTNWWLLPESSYQVSFTFENEQSSVAGKRLWIGKAASGKLSVYIATPAFHKSHVVGNFTLPKHEYFIGEPIYVTFTVTNQGTTPIRFPIGGDYAGRHERFSFVARNDMGNRVPDPVVNPLPGLGPGGYRELKSGETYTETLLVNQWCAFHEPGRYTVTGQRTLNLLTQPEGLDWVPEEIYPTLPIQSKLSINLRRDHQALATYIESLLTRLQGKDNHQAREEMTALALAKNEAVFPALEKLVREPGPYQTDAVRWISYFGEAKAGPILRVATKSPDPVTRTEALGTLAPWKVADVLSPVQKALLSPDPN